MIWFVNYQKLHDISVNDRGLTYGDGVFETLLVDGLGVVASEFHKKRLMRACHRLRLPFTQSDLETAFHFIQSNLPNGDQHCVKIIVSRGAGGRGYLPPENPKVTVAIGFMSVPDYSSQAFNGVGIKVLTSQASIHTGMSGLKHLNRLENVLAKQELAAIASTQHTTSYFEGLLLDHDEYLVECIQSNLFWFKNNMLFTPVLNRSGVQGTLRSQIMKLSSDSINVGHFRLNDLEAADEVFITNRLMSIVPVTCLASGEQQSTYPIGRKTRALQRLLNNCSMKR